MAYKRNHLLFIKKDSDGTIAKAASYAADRFKGVVITDADELTANFKSTDGTGDASLIKLHLSTSCKVDFKIFCRMLAGALAGHSFQPGGAVVVADDVNRKYLHGANLSEGDGVTEITL
jgi:hypothetical protein